MCAGVKPADGKTYYKFVWVDLKVRNRENYAYTKCMQALGFEAVQLFADAVAF